MLSYGDWSQLVFSLFWQLPTGVQARAGAPGSHQGDGVAQPAHRVTLLSSRLTSC